MTDPPASSPDAAAAVTAYRALEALLPPHWAGDSVVANGARHHCYRTGGGKPPLLLLHGFLDGAAAWLRTGRALEGEFDVVIPDARGHGRSERSGPHFGPDQLAEDAAGILGALGLAPAYVVGHSMGGGTGIRLADRHPELVRALIVEGWRDTAAQGTNLAQSPQYQQWFNPYVGWLERLKTLDHAERMTSVLAQLPPGSPLLPEDEYVPWVDNCAHVDLDLVGLGATLWSRMGADLQASTEALGRITCPMLVMKSDFFPTPGERRVHDEASERPNLRIVRFEHTGHLIHRDAFGSFVERVREFLLGHEAAAAGGLENGNTTGTAIRR